VAAGAAVAFILAVVEQAEALAVAAAFIAVVEVEV
jgi:hypothetical protein